MFRKCDTDVSNIVFDSVAVHFMYITFEHPKLWTCAACALSSKEMPSVPDMQSEANYTNVSMISRISLKARERNSSYSASSDGEQTMPLLLNFISAGVRDPRDRLESILGSLSCVLLLALVFARFVPSTLARERL